MQLDDGSTSGCIISWAGVAVVCMFVCVHGRDTAAGEYNYENFEHGKHMVNFTY